LRVRRLFVLDEQERLLGSVGLGELQRGPRTAPPEDEEIFVHPHP
jgi:CBS-domain-containing membrane protein